MRNSPTRTEELQIPMTTRRLREHLRTVYDQAYSRDCLPLQLASDQSSRQSTGSTSTRTSASPQWVWCSIHSASHRCRLDVFIVVAWSDRRQAIVFRCNHHMRCPQLSPRKVDGRIDEVQTNKVTFDRKDANNTLSWRMFSRRPNEVCEDMWRLLPSWLSGS